MRKALLLLALSLSTLSVPAMADLACPPAALPESKCGLLKEDTRNDGLGTAHCSHHPKPMSRTTAEETITFSNSDETYAIHHSEYCQESSIRIVLQEPVATAKAHNSLDQQFHHIAKRLKHLRADRLMAKESLAAIQAGPSQFTVAQRAHSPSSQQNFKQNFTVATNENMGTIFTLSLSISVREGRNPAYLVFVTEQSLWYCHVC